MVAALLAIAVATLPSPVNATGTGPVAPGTLVHLGVVLRLTHQAQLDALRVAQQDPQSPSFRRWLTPEQFGQQFGQAEGFVDQTAAWLRAGGLDVTSYPNRTFLEARGTAMQVEALLGVELEGVSGQPTAVHIPNGKPHFPAWLQPQVVFVSGLDTRVRFHHRLWDSFGDMALGPQDLRAQYDVAALQAAGFYGQGQQLVVLSYAEAPGNEVQRADVEWFYQNLSDARTPFQENVLPNPEGDFDPEPGGRLEFELDVEMQSVGCPGAQSITLEEVPASQVFVLGPQDIANNMPNATAVSVSLGDCEPAELQQSQSDNEITAMRNALIQGTMEGQTWSAASGDNGSDDCGIGMPPATVDFPASIPEMIAMGGTEISDAGFNQNIAITSYNTEEVWNDTVNGGFGGAGGGGISMIFPAPAYQSGFGFSGRSVPDLSLIAGSPSAISVSNEPGELDPTEGTSVASPLSAGFFGLMASALGCRLGDVHATLYALGAVQHDGGPKVFHDITLGDNSTDGVTGYIAMAGYNSATGWGSMDVAALVKAFPACPVTDAGPVMVDAGPAYSQCGFIGCATNSSPSPTAHPPAASRPATRRATPGSARSATSAPPRGRSPRTATPALAPTAATPTRTAWMPASASCASASARRSATPPRRSGIPALRPATARPVMSASPSSASTTAAIAPRPAIPSVVAAPPAIVRKAPAVSFWARARAPAWATVRKTAEPAAGPATSASPRRPSGRTARSSATPPASPPAPSSTAAATLASSTPASSILPTEPPATSTAASACSRQWTPGWMRAPKMRERPTLDPLTTRASPTPERSPIRDRSPPPIPARRSAMPVPPAPR